MGVIFTSADREPATFTQEFFLPRDAKGVIVFVNYTAEGGGTATLDFKLQHFDAGEGGWDDITGASLAQFTGVGESDLTLYPGIAAVANRAVSTGVTRRLRAVAVVGTDNLTFSSAFEPLF